MHARVNLPDRFTFSAPARIEFRVGAANAVAEEAKQLGGTSALVVAEGGVIAAGIVEPIVEILAQAGLRPSVFSDFSPNPKDYEAPRGLKAAQDQGTDILIGVGGGSSMDMAKVVGMLMTNPGQPRDYLRGDPIESPLPPVIAIPTTSGTGSEVSTFAVLTDTEAGVKVGMGSPHLVPKVALMDPSLTKTVPPHVTAATGIDALCHAFEAYTCTVANPIAEGMALYAIELVGRYLRRAVEDGADIEARAMMQLASAMAGITISTSDCCGVHHMAESYGGLVDLPHGTACAIFLPHVFEFNMEADWSKHAKVGEALGAEIHGLSAEAAARQALDAVWQLLRDVGIPRLKTMPGVDPGLFGTAARHAAETNLVADTQPRPTSEQDYLDLFQKAWAD